MNSENLIPNSARTPKERQELAKKAGKKSGESRRDKKHIQEALKKALNGEYEIDEKKLTGYDALAISILKEALQGNVQAFKEIRDSIGEKPTENVNLDNESISSIKIKFVDKSTRHGNHEDDPKIVGDYTPPTNTE